MVCVYIILDEAISCAGERREGLPRGRRERDGGDDPKGLPVAGYGVKEDVDVFLVL